MFIVLDIDGCITNGKGKVIDLIALQTLKQNIQQSKYPTALCTGRSALYVEAIAQMLDIKNWCICENGAYLYHTVTEKVKYHPNVMPESRKQLQQIKNLLTTDKKFTQICTIELGKEICISLNPIRMSIEELFVYLKNELNLEGLYITHSTTAVDITPANINKGNALKWLSQTKDIKLEDIIGVGDSMGDMSFLELCGTVACPNNAIDEIKQIADFISSQPSTNGLIEIYNWLV